MTPRSFSIATLGCRANQADSDRLRAILLGAGLEEKPFGEKVDCAVVNTCTVTSEADRKSRQLLRRALRVLPPEGKAIATGCAVAKRGGLEKMPTTALKLPPDQRDQILSLLDVEQCPGRENLKAISLKTRALLKIQDGCDQFCTFCIVPYVRGRSKSVALQDLVERARELEKDGYQELVLTGIHLAIWGHDLEGSPDLSHLVSAMLEATASIHIRISSVEPDRFPLALIDLMKQNPRVCPYLHLVLQHASDTVLERMHRGYDLATYRGIIDKFFAEVPYATLSSDIMIGFPGENEKDHKILIKFLQETPYYHLHVFPYSVRPGTAASKFGDRVDSDTKKRRRDDVLKLAATSKIATMRQLYQRRLEVIFESEIKPGWFKGTAMNGMSVVSKAGPAVLHSRVPVSVTRRLGFDLVGRVSTRQD